MSTRRRLTRPTAFVAAVLVVLGVGGGASALGQEIVNRTVPLPSITGNVQLCVLNPATMAQECVTAPEPLAQGASLTVKAATTGAGASTPSVAVAPATCPNGQSGTAISVTTAGAAANVSAVVSGTGALSGVNVSQGLNKDQPANTHQVFTACVNPKVG